MIVYHEQVMRCISAVTGCDMTTADLVRRRLGDPGELDELHRWVLAGAAERGIAGEVAESLWHALAQFASFGFCKAHAAAFAVPTYRSAWLKAHYLPEFVAGLLTHDPGMYPRRLLLDDARQFGVAVLPLDVNRSDRVYRVERLPAEEALALLGIGGGVEAGVGAGAAPTGRRVGHTMVTDPSRCRGGGGGTTNAGLRSRRAGSTRGSTRAIPGGGSGSGWRCRTSPGPIDDRR